MRTRVNVHHLRHHRHHHLYKHHHTHNDQCKHTRQMGGDAQEADLIVSIECVLSLSV